MKTDSQSYRYGFQGQEMDDEIKGKGNSVNYKYRMHDPRVGRFFAVDPLEVKYPQWAPYAFSGNQVIHTVEIEGLEPTSDKANYWSPNQYSYSDIEARLDANIHNKFVESSVRTSYGQPKIMLTKAILLDASDDATDGVAWFGALVHPWARRNLSKYLLGDGGVDIYSYDELSSNSHFDLLVDRNNSVIEGLVEKTGSELKNGEGSTLFAGENYSVVKQGGSLSDFVMAFGSVQMVSNAEITIWKGNDGIVSYSGTVKYTFYDTYDFNDDIRGGGMKEGMGIADNLQMNDLKHVGASEFYSRSYFTGNVSGGSISGFKVGSYKDAIDLNGFTGPDDPTNTIPESNNIRTYDGRKE